MRIQRAESPVYLADFDAARRFFASRFAEEKPETEKLWVAHIDAASSCVLLQGYSGHHATVSLPIRSIIADAARLSSSGLILAHNHPSGDPTPSHDDCRATRALARAGEPLQVAVIDHLVFAGGDKCRSMRQMGLV